MLHWTGPLSQLKADLRNERLLLDHITKKSRKILISDIVISRDQWYHTLFLGSLMMTRLLPDTPSLHPTRFKYCERECLCLNDHSRSLNASDWALCSCLNQSLGPTESKAQSAQVKIACPFWTQVKCHSEYERQWSLLEESRYQKEADSVMDSKT